MNATNYIFRAARNVTPKELHCLWATLTDKAHQDKHDEGFRIQAVGRQINVVTSRELPTSDVSLDTNQFDFLRKVSQPQFSYQNGQYVTLQGQMAYSVHSRETGKDLCPVDAFGRIKPELKDTFLRYLDRRTGLAVSQAGANDRLFSWDSMDSDELGKVWLNDIISVQITAKVVDASVLNALAINAIGRRKSYGLGSMFVMAASTPDEQEAI